MRKMLLTPLMVCIATLLFVLLTPAAYAEPPTAVESFWPVHVPTSMDPRVPAPDGHTFMEATTDDEWTGTIAGVGSCVQRLVIHSSGFWYAKGILTLDPCTVNGNGEQGTLVISWSGKGTAEGQWTGQWVILSGTEDLANLHGQGTWCGPDANGNYPIAGKIHFDP